MGITTIAEISRARGVSGAYHYDAYPYGGYYGSYGPYGYGARVAVYPSYGYRGYRPLLSVSVGGPHFGVWLGF